MLPLEITFIKNTKKGNFWEKSNLAKTLTFEKKTFWKAVEKVILRNNLIFSRIFSKHNKKIPKHNICASTAVLGTPVPYLTHYQAPLSHPLSRPPIHLPRAMSRTFKGSNTLRTHPLACWEFWTWHLGQFTNPFYQFLSHFYK